MRVPGGHIGQDHLVAHLQAFHHFDRVHRTPTQSYLRPGGFLGLKVQLEQAYQAVRLPDYRTPYIDKKLIKGYTHF